MDWRFEYPLQDPTGSSATLAVLLYVALATYFFFCPPWTGCVGWPNWLAWNWANLISGLLAAVAIGLHLSNLQGNRSTVMVES
jgi:hypothetical protein